MFGGSNSGGGQGSQQQGNQDSGYGDQSAGGAGQGQQQAPQPCEGEMGQFVQCALNSTEMTDCMGYLDTLKTCRDNVMQQYQSM